MDSQDLPSADKPTEQPGSDLPAWAQRLAERRKAHDAPHEAGGAEMDWPLSAVTGLWTLFDEAAEQANQALDRSDAAERILLHRTMREYRLSMAGPEGEERQIAVFASLALVGGRPSGGARITTSQTRASILLDASVSSRRMRWTIAESGIEFSERVVRDLFLSVFSDDPTATRRLSAHFTLSS